MAHKENRRAKPRITLTRTDAERLARLAATMADRMPEVSDELLAEIDRAELVDDDSAPDEAVRMGSTVSYDAGGEVRTVTVVYPREADIAQGKVSVMTPVGAALIGLAAGQSISWRTRDGREHELTVREVHQLSQVPVPA